MTDSEKRMSRALEIADDIEVNPKWFNADNDAQIADALRMSALQARVLPWLIACFPPELWEDPAQRNHRFLEEALELVQARGCTRSEAHSLVDWVFARDQGDVNQEVGGVMITLAALCIVAGEDMHKAGEDELARIWTKIDAIRAKQATKPATGAAPPHRLVRAGCPYTACPSPFICKAYCKVVEYDPRN